MLPAQSAGIRQSRREMDILVAETEQGEIVGTAAWKKAGADEAHIRGMAVHPELAGKW
jgi:N-acetylglutamate synthase-like GNAT family acetyltransferase